MNTITIGIPAFNEEKNIDFLLKEILIQSFNGYRLTKIIVISDGSTDDTVAVAKSVLDSRIVVIDGTERRGKSARLNEIIFHTNTDYLILLDADVSIADKYFLKKLLKPIVSGKTHMTSSALEEKSPKRVFEQVLYVSMKLKFYLFNEFKNGNNVYNCHGPARAFSRELYKKLKFPDFSGDDMFSYLTTKRLGMKFKYVPEASVCYRLPSNPTDHYKQSTRYLKAIENCEIYFGEEFVEKEFGIPVGIYVSSAIKALPYILPNFILVFTYLLVFACVHIASTFRIKVNESWNVVSSKNLN